MMHQQSVRLNLASIDILRGLAASYVFVYHAWGFFLRGKPVTALPIADGFWSPLLSAFDVFAKHGWLGVPLFFVLSGFCVHLPQAQSASLGWKSYLSRRFIRIWPPYAVAVLLGVAMAVARGSESGAEISVNGLLHLVFWIWATDPMSPADSALNAVSWSIVVEVHLYLIYLITWPLLRRVGIWRVTAWALALGVLYHLAVATGGIEGTMPNALNPRNFAPARFGEWLLGAAIAEWVIKRPRGLARFAGPAPLFAAFAATGVLLVASARWGWSQYSLETFFACAAGVLILHAVALEQRSELFRNSAFTRVSAMVGLRCYSLYLFHYPVLAIMAELAIRTVFAAEPNKDALAGSWLWGMTTLVGMGTVVVATELVYRVIELPSHRLARKVGDRVRRLEMQDTSG